MKKPPPLTESQKAQILGDPVSNIHFPTPVRVISLWDMIQSIVASKLQTHLEMLTRLSVYAAQNGPDVALTDDLRNSVVELCDALEQYCIGMEMRVSRNRLKTMRRWVAGRDEDRMEIWRELRRDVDAFQEDFEEEMNERLLIILPPDKRVSYCQEKLFGELVYKAFPSARKDISAAGDCIAIELSTAAVFHLMRASEFGLRALAEHLGAIPAAWPIEFSQWKEVIAAIKIKLDEKERLLMQMTKGFQKDESLELYRALLAEVNHLKLSRDRVMHTRAWYDSIEADGQRHLVEGFLVRIATTILKDADSDFQI
jgi:hypothetical protein